MLRCDTHFWPVPPPLPFFFPLVPTRLRLRKEKCGEEAQTRGSKEIRGDEKKKGGNIAFVDSKERSGTKRNRWMMIMYTIIETEKKEPVYKDASASNLPGRSLSFFCVVVW